jgi:hypothetical protein
VLAQCDARLPAISVLEEVLDAAIDGCHAGFEILQARIRERASTLMVCRASHATVKNACPTVPS